MWWIRGNVVYDKAVPEHKVLASGRYLREFANKIQEKLSLNEMKLWKRRFIEDVISIFTEAVTSIVSPLYVLNLMLKGDITLGDFSFYTAQISKFNSEIMNLFSLFIDIFDMSISIDPVRKLLETPNIIISGKTKIDTTLPPTIEFKHVWFKYPSGNDYVLKDLNLTIEPGKEIAIVGENGAGKTTLIKLLMRFYDPTKGEIFINNVPLKDISLNQYYRMISVLFQEYNNVPALDIKNNIFLGQPFSKLDLEKVKSSAKLAEADVFISKLKYKYNTVMSSSFKNGTNLSTGQEQKIALARMFYKNSQILVLDEPTASIDASAEHKIFNRIYKYMSDKTVIIISHRFSTVRKAKEIIVLKDGRVTEQGSHEILMKLKGEYANLYTLQSSSYK